MSKLSLDEAAFLQQQSFKQLIGYKFKSAKAVQSVEVLTGLDMEGWAANLENTGVNFLYGSNVLILLLPSVISYLTRFVSLFLSR